MYYVYYYSGYVYYIWLTNGKTVSDALDEMLGSTSYTTNSTIKTNIENWFISSNLYYYDSYIDGEVYCYDKSYSSIGSWNPNTESLTYYIYFNSLSSVSSGTPTMICNVNDSYIVENGKNLYEIGLLTSDESMLACSHYFYNKSTCYLYIGQSYWLAGASRFSTGAEGELLIWTE